MEVKDLSFLAVDFAFSIENWQLNLIHFIRQIKYQTLSIVVEININSIVQQFAEYQSQILFQWIMPGIIKKLKKKPNSFFYDTERQTGRGLCRFCSQTGVDWSGNYSMNINA